MEEFFNFSVITDNFKYFMIARFPEGPLGEGLRNMIPSFVNQFVSLILCFFFTSLSRWLEERLSWRKAI